MARSSTLSLFVTALVLAGAKAADRELGQSCTDSDTCLHPTIELVCDDASKLCLIKQGQACSEAGLSTLCVTGAACESNTCKCKGVYTANSTTGKCNIPANLWMATCAPGSNSAGDCTALSGLACPAGATRCGCMADKRVDLSTGKCTTDIATEKIGKECTTGGNECGEAATTHLTCPGDNEACVCETGYAGPTGGDCAQIPAQREGHLCTTPNEATDCGAVATTNLRCPIDNCTCAANYYGVTGGVCYPEIKQLNGGCASSCSAPGTICTGLTEAKKCVCKSGYTAKADKSGCDVSANKLDGSCTGTAGERGSCEDANAVCSGSTCSCKSGYSGPPAGTCVADNKVNGQCTGGPNAKGSCNDMNALCSAANGVCNCKEGYSDKPGGGCTMIANNTFGGSCTADAAGQKGTCKDTNAQCTAATGGFCRCKSGYKGTEGGGCALPNKLGGSCNALTKDTKGTCEDPNALCSAQTDGQCYIKSGACNLFVSATSMLLVVLACLVNSK